MSALQFKNIVQQAPDSLAAPARDAILARAGCIPKPVAELNLFYDDTLRSTGTANWWLTSRIG